MILKTKIETAIHGWGAYVPRYRIPSKEIARIWGQDPARIEKGLLLKEKAVAGPDEDTATLAVEAALNALKRAKINPKNLGGVFVGSESHPYYVKSTASTVAEAIGATPYVIAASLEFACKAGTDAMLFSMGLVGSGMVEYSLAIGADIAQGAPGDALEYSAGGGAVAFIIGKKNSYSAAYIEAAASYVTDTPDFWRRPYEKYPKHGEAFTGEPAYFKHVIGATKTIMEELGYKPSDFKYAVFHQPNGKFPLRVGKRLGFSEEQIRPGLLTPIIGNTYAASSIIGLAAVLDIANPGDRILITSFGSGAGSDSFVITAQEGIKEKQSLAPKVSDYVNRKVLIDYGLYVKFREKIKIEG